MQVEMKPKPISVIAKIFSVNMQNQIFLVFIVVMETLHAIFVESYISHVKLARIETNSGRSQLQIFSR